MQIRHACARERAQTHTHTHTETLQVDDFFSFSGREEQKQGEDSDGSSDDIARRKPHFDNSGDGDDDFSDFLDADVLLPSFKTRQQKLAEVTRG